LAYANPFFYLKIRLRCICEISSARRQHNKACISRLFALQRRGALFLLTLRRVRLRRDNVIARFDDHPRDGLVRGKRAAAIDVAALMVTLFGRLAQIATGASVGHVTA
jgi:hypothetical protein